eukprot:s822_g12.t1
MAFVEFDARILARNPASKLVVEQDLRRSNGSLLSCRMDFAAVWQDGASGSCSMTPGEGSCSSTGSTKSTCRADAEYTIDIEKEVDKLIEDPSRPSRPRRREKRRDGNQTLSFLHPIGDKGNVSAGLAAYRAKGLATLQAMEMHDRPLAEPRGESTHDAGLSAYRAHGLATLQAMEASNGMWPTTQVYTSPSWYGRSEAPTFYAAEWMPPPGTVLVPAGMAQARNVGHPMPYTYHLGMVKK